ncbi:hypothetical protein IE077_003535 [Cardiosporidium cionae]|uniref:TERF2-interacting telomeric protein 1 Myb domain-containing protein n=1 Tax=Cardiosporidium cionae TaxID=476202 RepID=A0ABQ7JET9_9APIC|nr:hypothetical protein IE077_003535 [Cardiosporidium cionae]|eukprot:KAF8822526.1 hypothetical protein IE077_003535 [Cardiosporidium cionae]
MADPSHIYQGRQAYTATDSKAIFVYAMAHQKHMRGNQIWKKAEEDQLTKHSWMSMRNHFLNSIYPRVEEFSSTYGSAPLLANFDPSERSYSLLQPPLRRDDAPPSIISPSLEEDDIEETMDIEQEEEEVTSPFTEDPSVSKITSSSSQKRGKKRSKTSKQAASVCAYSKRSPFPRYFQNFSFYRHYFIEITSFLTEKADYAAMRRMERLKKEKLAFLSSNLQNMDVSVIRWINDIHYYFGISHRQAFIALEEAQGHTLLAIRNISNMM